MSDSAIHPVTVRRIRLPDDVTTVTDVTASEEPLEIRVEGRSVAVVMRTPGHDEELVAGFLVSEGIIKNARDILEISQCPSTGNVHGNVVDVLLGAVVVNWDHLTRHVFSASSCGICGKTSIESVFMSFPPVTSDWLVSAELLTTLPAKLRAAQETFSQTGGLHASAIFDEQGEMLVLREDVGRHNALDKVLGHGLKAGLLPYSRHILLVSGRVSFELMQKALAAGVPIVAAISAPSSLAVQFAESSGQTLVGFLRGQTMNVYTHPERVSCALATSVHKEELIGVEQSQTVIG
jgi:FdhD protein